MPILKRLAFALLVLLFVAPAARRGEAAIPGGTRVVNVANATYADANGTAFTTISNTLATTVTAIAAMVVGPNDPVCHAATGGFPSGTPIIKTFSILNASNVDDSYTITSASVSAGTITSMSFVTPAGSVPVTPGSTVSPTLTPTNSMQLVVDVATLGIPVGTNVIVRLTVRTTNTSTSNGLQSAVASSCSIAQLGASLGGTHGLGTTILKHVDDVSAAQSGVGSVVTYQIPFSNNGSVPATNVVLVDNVPSGVLPDGNTIEINGAAANGAGSLSGQQVRVALGTVAAGATDTVSFNATVSKTAGLGSSFVNVASVSADNAVAVQTAPASVLTGVANVVYDGYNGASEPVAGAVVTLVADTSAASQTNAALRRTTAVADAPVTPGGATGAGPNLKNANPFVTATDGTYGFGLSPAQFTSSAYDLVISAPGYLLRRLHLSLVGDPTQTFYTCSVTSLDGQPLAMAGAFTLTNADVKLANVYGLFGNIPLFRPHAIGITKQVDRSAAASGDRLVYTIVASNANVQLGATTVVDTQPRGIAYVPGTARVDDIALEPAIDGRNLTWSFPTFTAAHTIEFAAVIVPGVSDGTLLTNTATVSAKLPNSQNLSIGAAASATTQILPGVFSNRTIITGRVFADLARTGRFAPEDRGLGGVRLFLEDGESVLSDGLGRFSFPGVRPGMHVLRLDTTTLPQHTQAYDDSDIDSERSIRRLIHGIFDGGVMQDVDFAIDTAR